MPRHHPVIDYERPTPPAKPHWIETVQIWVLVVLCGGVALVALLGAAAILLTLLFDRK